MAYYTAFQSNAFQSNAFQIARFATGPELLGGGPGGGKKKQYSYATPHQRYVNEESQREKIRKEKSDLEKLESVLRETERKKAIAEESKKQAKKTKKLKRAIELEKLEREYLEEINRLLMVRADLLRQIRGDEDFLFIMMVARKRRLRAA